MPEARQPIPRPLERDVLLEAGHRCAIPTCRQTPVDLAHIEPWAKVREHVFENLIALCPTCHRRFDQGEIDRPAMRQYKANLGLINARYGDLERRIFTLFAKEPRAQSIWLPGGLDILLLYALADGLLADTGKNSGVIMAGMPSAKLYALTPQGRAFVDKLAAAKEIE